MFMVTGLHMLTLDCTELKCPLPLLKLKLALSDMAEGEVIRLSTTDPVSCRDIPKFCLATSNQLLKWSSTTPFHFDIKKGN